MNCPFCDSILLYADTPTGNVDIRFCVFHCLNDKCEVYPFVALYEVLSSHQLGVTLEVSFRVNDFHLKFYPGSPCGIIAREIIISRVNHNKDPIIKKLPANQDFDPFSYKGKVCTPNPDPNPDKIDTLEKKNY